MGNAPIAAKLMSAVVPATVEEQLAAVKAEFASVLKELMAAYRYGSPSQKKHLGNYCLSIGMHQNDEYLWIYKGEVVAGQI